MNFKKSNCFRKFQENAPIPRKIWNFPPFRQNSVESSSKNDRFFSVKPTLKNVLENPENSTKFYEKKY